MNKFLILKDNLVTNLVTGQPSINEGETLIEATGSISSIAPGSYYLPSSQTFYSPLNSQLQIPSHLVGDVTSSFQGIVGTGSNNITITYTDDISPSPTLSNLTSEDVTISNLSSTSNSLTFDVTVTDEFISSSLDKITISFDHNNITDSNNNPLYSMSSNGVSIYNVEYTSSL